MSKSKGNVISPVDYVERYGADTARCYILFIGPPDQDADWSDEGIEGVYRFLSRLWRLGVDVAAAVGEPGPPLGPLDGAEGDDLELMRKAHWAIDKVTNDMAGRFAFNTAISAVMELVNECYRRREVALAGGAAPRDRDRGLADLPLRASPGVGGLRLLTGERVWEQPWPDADPALLERDTVELVVQVNGKLRDRVQAPASASREELEGLARTPRIESHVNGKDVVKVIVVPGKLVNFVVALVALSSQSAADLRAGAA